MKPALVAALITLLALPVGAQVFKCGGPGGITYSQTPCQAGGQLLDPRVPPSPEEQAAQPLTQRREVERAMRPADPVPEPEGASIIGQPQARQATPAPPQAPRARHPAVKPPAAPRHLTNCDRTGCWDTQGNRYNNAAGGMYRQDGTFCYRVAGGLRCD